jgi:hypothetical protein
MEIVTLDEKAVDGCSDFIKIIDVVDGSPADKAGFIIADIILSANEISVCRKNNNVFKEFKHFIKMQGINSEIRLDILRNGEELSLTASLKERPIQVQDEASHINISTCTEPTSLLKRELQTDNNLRLFNRIRSDLNYHTNLVHNYGWSSKKPANPYQLKEFTYMLRHPLQSGTAAEEVTDQIMEISDHENEISDISDYLSGLIDIDSVSHECRDITFPALISKIDKAYKNIETVVAVLSSEERSLLREKAVMPWDDESWNKVLELSFKIDLQKLMNAVRPLLACLSNGKLSSLQKDLINRFKDTGSSVLYETDTVFGKVIVGGAGPNRYEEDAALILDIGGNDIYLNNAGGTRSGIPVAIVIDWEGNDSYITKKKFSQGSGVLGSGILVDLDGKDTFEALDGSQGAGLFGLGILYNSGGNTVFKGRYYCQGTGQHGIGMLINNDSDTLYQCSGYGQALGFFKAAGMVLDKHGNDRYLLGGLKPDFRDPAHSTVSMGQGFGKGFRAGQDFDGISGGIGVLIDKEGDDHYFADYFAQGASYYFGIGILSDISGNDKYSAGRYAQGAGIHSSSGVLTDRTGNDFYYASFGVSQGMGHDFGVGFLKDGQGDDLYTAGTLSQGASTTGGMGIVFDADGKDMYTVKQKGQAHTEDESGMGIMIDLQPSIDSVSSRKDISRVRIGVTKNKQ